MWGTWGLGSPQRGTSGPGVPPAAAGETCLKGIGDRSVPPDAAATSKGTEDKFLSLPEPVSSAPGASPPFSREFS